MQTLNKNQQIYKLMNRMKWILLATAAVTLGSCNSESEQTDNVGQQVELRLSSSLDLQTRAAYTFTQNTQITSGEKVYAWVDEAKTSGAVEYIQAWQLTADGNGNFSGDTKHYPVSGNPVDVYAVHGNFATAPSGSFPTAALTHSVASDQSALADYAKSDLLYAQKTGCVRQSTAHQLDFNHLLSKIEVYLVAGTGTTDAELATAQVTILNTKPDASVTLSKTAAPAITASGTAADITAMMQSQTDQTVTIEGSAQNAYAFAEAIIVPQWVNTTGASGGADVDFIKITIGTSSYIAQINKQFTGGNRYTYNVVVNKSGIVLTSTINPWGEGGTEIINAK